MKAKELISLLQNNLDAEVVVSTCDYYERNFQDAGYRRGEKQKIEIFTVDLSSNQVHLGGGRSRKI